MSRNSDPDDYSIQYLTDFCAASLVLLGKHNCMYCAILGVCSYFTEKSTLWNNKREVGLFLRVDLLLGDYDVKRVDDVQAKPCADSADTFYRGYSLNNV